MVRLVGKGKDSPAGIRVNISGGSGRNMRRGKPPWTLH